MPVPRYLFRRLAATIGLAVMTSSCAGGLRLAAPAVAPGGVRFVMARADADSVSLAGTFNEWSSAAHRLVRDRTGLWTIVVPLPPGEYLFMYVVNGSEWISPPLAEEYADDGFGAKNGVVLVRP